MRFAFFLTAWNAGCFLFFMIIYKLNLVFHRKMLNLTIFMYSTYLNFQTFAQRFAYGICIVSSFKLNRGCHLRFKTNGKIEGHHLTLSWWRSIQHGQRGSVSFMHRQFNLLLSSIKPMYLWIGSIVKNMLKRDNSLGQQLFLMKYQMH